MCPRELIVPILCLLASEELDLTSETCRSLAESNNTLKARNDTLLQRIPSSGASSPSILGSPSSSISYLSHQRTPSSNPPWSPKFTPPLSNRRLNHRRRVSANPAELAALADQNAELLSRLADLEADSARAESAGKRRLKSLETEIAGLREELERVRSESERPSSYGRRQTGDESSAGDSSELLSELAADAQVLKMLKKLTREAKVRELKEKTRPWDKSEDTSEGLKNFAPGNFAPGLPFTSKWVARKSSTQSLTLDTAHLKPFERSLTHSPSFSPSPSTPSSGTPTAATAGGARFSPAKGSPSKADREHALVSQLLLKIRELEETNAQLASDHVTARERLRNAQTETESVRQLCELISQGVDESMEFDLELELINDEDTGNIDDGPQLEMDFGGALEEAGNDQLSDLSAFQRRKPKTIRVRSVSRKSSLDFGTGTQKHSLRVRRTASIDSFVTAKSRVFDEADDDEFEEDTDRHPKRERKSVMGLFDNFSRDDLSLSLPGAMPKTPDARKASLDSINLDSPYKRVSEVQDDEDDSQLRSLGSELGLALQGMRPAPAHNRSRSIMELFQGFENAASTSASPSMDSMPSSSSHHALPRSTNAAGRTKTGVQRLIDESDGFDTISDTNKPRLRRSSTQIPARQSQTPPSLSSSQRTRTPPSSPPMARRLFSSQSLASLTPSRSSPGRHQRTFSTATRNSEPANKALNMLVEVWLWLQFALVLGVVLFSMARMGPKSFFKPPATAAKQK